MSFSYYYFWRRYIDFNIDMHRRAGSLEVERADVEFVDEHDWEPEHLRP